MYSAGTDGRQERRGTFGALVALAGTAISKSSAMAAVILPLRQLCVKEQAAKVRRSSSESRFSSPSLDS